MGFTKHIRLPECANGKADEEKLGCCVGLAITPTPRVCSAVLLCCCAAVLLCCCHQARCAWKLMVFG